MVRRYGKDDGTITGDVEGTSRPDFTEEDVHDGAPEKHGDLIAQVPLDSGCILQRRHLDKDLGQAIVRKSLRARPKPTQTSRRAAEIGRAHV